MRAKRRGFTLIELLVVIGLIAVLAGVLGLALGRGNSGTALQSAQNTTAAMIAGARARAATKMANSAVFINVSPDSEGFLRELRMATSVGGAWVDAGVVNELPAGIYLVPATTAFSTSNVDYVGDNPAWTASTPRSSAFNGSAVKIKTVDGAANISPADYRILADFTPRGTTGSNSLSDIVLAPGDKVLNDKIIFNNAAALRGITISTYGITTLINEPAAF